MSPPGKNYNLSFISICFYSPSIAIFTEFIQNILKVIVFPRGRQSTNLKFTLNGSELEIVNEFNYLGILFNRTGNFNKTIKKQAEKAIKAMFEVLKRGRTHNLSIECQLELSNKMVKPILLYGSEIWGLILHQFQ
jgi:hypothetical protein